MRRCHFLKVRTAITIFLALLLLIVVSGCTIVRPSDAALIDTEAANARAYANAVDKDPAVPEHVKAWIKADAQQWTNLADWSNGRQPSPATQPSN